MALSIFAGFILLATVIAIVTPAPSLADRARGLYIVKGPRAGEETLVEHLLENPEDRGTWLELVRIRWLYRSGDLLAMPELEDILDDPLHPPEFRTHDSTPFLDDTEFDAFLATCTVLPVEVLRAWRDAHVLSIALAHLRELGDSLEAQLAGGEICLERGDTALAIRYYERARGLAPEDRRAVTGWFRALEAADRDVEVEAAFTDPSIRPFLDPRQVFEHHRERKEYLRGLIPLWRSEYENYGPGLWLTCFMIGACWTLLCFHLGHGWRWRRTFQWLVPVALLLGWLSGDVTLGAVIVTDDWIGKDFHDGISFSILYSLLIGAREELIKLLFFLPLLPTITKLGSDIQGLVIASLVGLGFAAHENANYYLSSEGGAILGRYLTANFFHLALTGYAGYFLLRAARKGGDEWREFGVALAKVIAFHAAYDLFLIEPGLTEYGIFSMILFILLSQQFLRLAFHVRPHKFQRVSLTRIFVGALATVAGMHYLYLSTRLGLGEALWQTIGGLLGIAIITFMFFQEFDEHVA